MECRRSFSLCTWGPCPQFLENAGRCGAADADAGSGRNLCFPSSAVGSIPPLFLPSLLSSPFLILPSAFSLYRDTILHTIEWPHLEAVTDGYPCAATVLVRIQDISITSGSLLCPCAGSTPVPGMHWPVTLGEFAWFTISYETHSTYLSHLVSCSPWYFCGSFTLHLLMALAF